MIARLLELVVEKPRLTLVGILAITALFASFIPGARFSGAADTFFVLEDFDKEEWRYYEIMDQISGILDRESGGEKFYISGIAATSIETNRAMIKDLKIFLPLAFLLVAMILAVSFRSVRGVVLPLATVVIGSVWTVGFMALAGIPISLVTVLLPLLIAAIGAAYAIHVMSEYTDELEEDEIPKEIVSSALRKVSLPIIVCGFTTMVGFGSLGLNRIPGIQDLGIVSVVGVFFSVVLALTLTPAALAILPNMRAPSREDQSGEKKPGIIDELLASLAGFDTKRRVLILAACMILCFIGLLYAFRMKIDTDFLGFFNEDAPISVSNRVQQEHLAGAAPFFVIIDGKEPDKLKGPEVLRRIEMRKTWMIEEYAARVFGADVEVQVTGAIRVDESSANEVARGQVRGILTCLAAIFLMMSLLFLSPRAGFLAMIPNVLPVLFLFGIMEYFEIPLNFSTSLIACIAIGLGVDYTIHFMSRYNDELKMSVNSDQAVRRTVLSVGKPVIYTSISLFFGFAIIAGSEFIPLRQFGLLTGMSIIVCLAADLLMLPALVTTVRINTLWDYVDMKTAHQSEADISIFNGLSRHQAKVATLMNVFGFYNENEEIIVKGEMVKDLFVVLEGRVVALNGNAADEGAEDDDGQPLRIFEGGEFGLLPGAGPYESSSTYLAETTAKLLIINPMSLDRLKSAHPKIAERIYLNLEQIKTP